MAKTIAVMTPKEKKMVLAAALAMYANFMLLSFALGVAHPTKLAAIKSMDFYSLSNAINAMGMMVSLPFAGRLADMFGRKRVVIIGLALHIALLGVTSITRNHIEFLTVFCLAGAAAGLYLSSPYVIVAEMVDAKARGKYYGILSTCAALGCLAGPIISGFLVDSGLYRLSYLAGLPLAVVVIVILWAEYPNVKNPMTAGKKLDVLGIFLLVLTIACLISYLNFGNTLMGGLNSVPALTVLAAGLVLAILLVRRENRHPNPSVPVKIFKNRNFTVSFISMILYTFYSASASAFIILFAQNVMGVSATLSATLPVPQTVTQALLGATVGAFFSKNPSRHLRPLFLGALAFGTTALFLWSTLTSASSVILIYIGMILGGAGVAMYQTVFTPFFQLTLPKEEYGAAQSLYTFASSSGSCLFSAIAGLILTSGMDYGTALALAFRTGAIGIGGGLIMAFFLVRVPQSEGKPQQGS